MDDRWASSHKGRIETPINLSIKACWCSIYSIGIQANFTPPKVVVSFLSTGRTLLSEHAQSPSFFLSFNCFGVEPERVTLWPGLALSRYSGLALFHTISCRTSWWLGFRYVIIGIIGGGRFIFIFYLWVFDSTLSNASWQLAMAWLENPVPHILSE